MNDKALPCPFCGYSDHAAKRVGEVFAITDVCKNPSAGKACWAIVCPKCWCQGPMTTEDDAIPAWNKALRRTDIIDTDPNATIN